MANVFYKVVTYGIVAIVLGSCSGIFGQSPFLISDKEYHEATSTSFKKTSERSRLVETNISFYNESGPYETSQDIWEYVPPDRKRRSLKHNVLGHILNIDDIYVGNEVYRREDNKDWKKWKSGSTSTSGSLSPVRSNELTQCNKYSVSLDGVSAYLYSLFAVERQPDGLLYNETKVWIGLDGLRLREERSSGGLYPKTETRREIITYKYDQNIKIEAPIK